MGTICDSAEGAPGLAVVPARRYPQTTLIGVGIGYRGGRWVLQRVWGEGRRVEFLPLLRHSSLRQCYFEIKTI